MFQREFPATEGRRIALLEFQEWMPALTVRVLLAYGDWDSAMQWLVEPAFGGCPFFHAMKYAPSRSLEQLGLHALHCLAEPRPLWFGSTDWN